MSSLVAQIMTKCGRQQQKFFFKMLVDVLTAWKINFGRLIDAAFPSTLFRKTQLWTGSGGLTKWPILASILNKSGRYLFRCFSFVLVMEDTWKWIFLIIMLGVGSSSFVRIWRISISAKKSNSELIEKDGLVQTVGFAWSRSLKGNVGLVSRWIWSGNGNNGLASCWMWSIIVR